jgi:hypothetical protein
VHLRLGAASAVVSAPLSPDCAAKVFRRAQGFGPGDGPRGRRLPRFGVPARWYDGMCASVGDGVVAPARGKGRPGNGPVDRFSPERAEP